MFVWYVLGAFGIFWTAIMVCCLLCSSGRGVLILLAGPEQQTLLAARRLRLLRWIGVLTCPVASVSTGEYHRELAQETDFVIRVSPLMRNGEENGDRTGIGDPAGNDPGSGLSE